MKKQIKNTKSLDKKDAKPKWPISRLINKFFVYNLFITLGVAMLICSLACKSVFDGDQTKIISNIVTSVVVILAGVAGGLVYSIILSKKGEKPLAEKYAKLTQFFFWVPIAGTVFDKIWKHYEKKISYQIKLKKHPDFKKPKLTLPSSIIIIFGALVVLVFLIWVLYIGGVIPSEYQDPKTGQIIKNSIPGILDIFLNPTRGFAGYNKLSTGEFVKGVGSIPIFLLLFNGAMSLVNDAKAIEAGIGSLLKKMRGHEIVLIPILMFILAVCGSTFNVCEQTLPLFLVVIPIMFAAGFDTMTGFLVVFMSAGVGVMASTVNPVLIGVGVNALNGAVEGLDLRVMDGIAWRLIMFVALTAISILCTTIYALKVKKNPQKSCVYLSQSQFKQKYTFDKDALPPMTRKRMWTLIVFGIAFLMLIVGFIDWNTICGFNGFNIAHDWLIKNLPFITSIDPIGTWGMTEAGFLFFVAAIIIGAINWKDAGHFISTLYAACKDFIGVVFILAIGKGLAITLTDSGLNRVVANGLGGVLSKIPAVMSILLVFIVIALLTTIIPSSSGLSSAMFPVIGPAICSVPAISVSGSVTSFAAAMGWMNLITPAGMLLPFLEVSKMDLGQFYKSVWKQIAILLVAGLVLLIIGSFVPGKLF